MQKKRRISSPLVIVKVQKPFQTYYMLWVTTFDGNLRYPNRRWSPINTFLLFEIITADISKELGV